MNVGVWHNGNLNLPIKETADGYRIPNASLAEIHEDRKQTIRDQIEYGILAEEKGFRRVSFSEHHFILSGAEFNPNPLQTQTAIAAQTDEIQLRQMGNIITWHDPIRMAEQTAILDIISDGRTEVGVGRGYQPRENEVLGQYWGGTVQDEEKNRMSFEEKVEILRKAWTEDLVSFSGSFHQIPPNYTKFHNPYERSYLEDDVSEYDTEDVFNWKEADNIDANWAINGPSTLNAIPIYPQPVQDPHPPMWQPVGSERSTEFAARNGINAYIPASSAPTPVIRDLIQMYHSKAEEAGWPDIRPEYDGEPFDSGWDDERKRGVNFLQPIHDTTVSDDNTLERWLEGNIGYQQYIGYFGFGDKLADDDEDPDDFLRGLEPEDLIERNMVIAGTTDEIIDQLAAFVENLNVNDFGFDIKFDSMGVSGEEINAQLASFGDNILPYLNSEFP